MKLVFFYLLSAENWNSVLVTNLLFIMTQSYWFLKRLAYLLSWLTSSRPLLLVAKSAIEAMLEEKNKK